MVSIKKLFQKRLPPVKAQELMEDMRRRRLSVEAKGEPWVPRGAVQAPVDELYLGEGVTVRGVCLAPYVPVQPSRRAVARETYKKSPNAQHQVTVPDGDAIERLPPVEMVWPRLRHALPRWTSAALLFLTLGGCSRECQVLAEKVVVPIKTFNCSDGRTNFTIQGADVLDVSSSAGQVRCYEAVLP